MNRRTFLVGLAGLLGYRPPTPREIYRQQVLACCDAALAANKIIPFKLVYYPWMKHQFALAAERKLTWPAPDPWSAVRP